MPKIIKILTDYFIGPIIVFGGYVVVYGHLLPGEGFDGGMIVASTLILCMVVYGREEMEKRISVKHAVIISATSALLFILLGNFLPQGNFEHLFSGGIIPILNVLVGLIVAFGFYAIFMYLVSYRAEKRTGV